ncbi:hypothetical protein ACFQE1_11015, partial [Halobium palmae]
MGPPRRSYAVAVFTGLAALCVLFAAYSVLDSIPADPPGDGFAAGLAAGFGLGLGLSGLLVGADAA